MILGEKDLFKDVKGNKQCENAEGPLTWKAEP